MPRPTFDHTDAVVPISGNPTPDEAVMIRFLEPVWSQPQTFADFARDVLNVPVAPWQEELAATLSTFGKLSDVARVWRESNPHTRIGY